MLFNVRSSFSFLQSTLAIETYVKKAKELGYTELGLADHGVLHGSLKFYQACQRAQVEAMIGLYIECPGRLDTSQSYPILVYALDYQGYLALIQLSKLNQLATTSHEMFESVFEQYRGHLVIISPGKKGEIELALSGEDTHQAGQILRSWQNLLGSKAVYLGLSIYPYNDLEVTWMREFADHHQVDLVCNQLVQALDREEGFALKILDAVARNETLDPSILTYQTAHYLYSQSELEHLYQQKGLGQVVVNSQALARLIKSEIPLNQPLLPRFQLPSDDVTAPQYLANLCQQQLTKLALDQLPVYQDRLEHELSTICQMGFADYFLIVWEIMTYCHQVGIRTGPGRGSAAGSLVAYLLQITRLDPIKYDLLFERFLNPERYNMPDIDIDIPDDQRERVLRYIQQKYGSDRVAQMITFGSFGAKQALRDVLRTLGFAKPIQDQWSRAIPRELGISLQAAYQQSTALKQLVHENELNEVIFRTALTIEGLPRHSSTHASGIVIADQDLSQLLPVIVRPQQLQLTQYDMGDVEAIGLLKMDFLGLKNLQLLDDVLQLIANNHSLKIAIDQIDRADVETLDLFKKAHTQGVFQFESEGIRQVLKQLQPESFEDIIAVNALYRPGPMQQIPHFIARKKGKEPIDYLHPDLEVILEKTYGIIVYQEQVMQICQRLAGFSLGQADLLRRAMGKKDIQIMSKQEEAFLKGCQAKGLDAETSQAIFQYIYRFANYGFNRAHAAVYSTLAYQLAYLKAHYPLEFFTCLLNQGRSLHQSLEDYLRDAKRSVGPLLSVSVNHSFLDFHIDERSIRTGFLSIKGMRQDFAAAIVKERELAGPFSDFQNFMSRLPERQLKADMIQLLIDSGAMDGLGYNRASLSENLPHFMQFRQITGNHLSLLQEIEPKMIEKKEHPQRQLLDRQRELLGGALAGHPIDSYQTLLDQESSFIRLSELSNSVKGRIKLIAYIDQVRVIETKKQELMAFYQISDGLSSINLVAFPDTYRRFNHQLKDGQVSALEVRLSKDRRGQDQLILERVLTLPEAKSNQDLEMPKQVFLKITSANQMSPLMEKVKDLALANPGPLEVILVDPQRNAWRLGNQYHLSLAHSVNEELKSLFGPDHVVYK